MPRLSEPRVVLYWGFLALGLFLIVRDDLVLSSILSDRTFTERLFPNNLRAQNIALAAAVTAAMPAGLLCLATAWGLRRGRKWSRWIGSLACICVLPVPPWLTL